MEDRQFGLYILNLETVLISFHKRICVIMTTLVSRKLRK